MTATANLTERSESLLQSSDSWAKARLRWELKTRKRWAAKTRHRCPNAPEQLTPPGSWLVWLLLGGRGSGKTRAGAEDVSDFARRTDDARIALVAPTFADVRDTMVEGESGLLSILPPSALRGGSIDTAWNRSMGELHFANGARAKAFSSEKPASLRGPQHHRAWVDELAYLGDAALGDVLHTTWNNLLLGLRLGRHPQVVVTGTPRPVKLVTEILDREGHGVAVSRMSTYDNIDNLAATFAAEILSRYEGTTIGRQELHAELLAEVEGALWRSELIDLLRRVDHPQLHRLVVGVDPSISSTGDECGIIVAGSSAPEPTELPDVEGSVVRHLPHGYVLEDVSLQAAPDVWAVAAVAAYHRHQADAVVAERNQGGEMVRSVIKAVDANVPVTLVHAAQGKHTRAQPISTLYEQGRVHHVGFFPELEGQMASWVPGDVSPDRMDALVWALWDVLLDGAGGPAALSSPAGQTLPKVRPRQPGSSVGRVPMVSRGGRR